MHGNIPWYPRHSTSQGAAGEGMAPLWVPRSGKKEDFQLLPRQGHLGGLRGAQASQAIIKEKRCKRKGCKRDQWGEERVSELRAAAGWGAAHRLLYQL